MLSRLEEALGALDQPTMDGINTYFVSWAAREVGLKVALSGWEATSYLRATGRLLTRSGCSACEMAWFTPAPLRAALAPLVRPLPEEARGKTPPAK